MDPPNLEATHLHPSLPGLHEVQDISPECERAAIVSVREKVNQLLDEVAGNVRIPPDTHKNYIKKIRLHWEKSLKLSSALMQKDEYLYLVPSRLESAVSSMVQDEEKAFVLFADLMNGLHCISLRWRFNIPKLQSESFLTQLQDRSDSEIVDYATGRLRYDWSLLREFVESLLNETGRNVFIEMLKQAEVRFD